MPRSRLDIAGQGDPDVEAPTSPANSPGKRGQAVYKRGVDTKRRIVERSIELFNQASFHTVSVEQIATDLGMSPGNITYYFRHKRDLVLAALDLLRERLAETVDRPPADAPGYGGHYLLYGLKTLWEFRFFFNSLVYLLSGDAELQAQYRQFRGWAVAAVARDLEGLVALGHLRRPEPPNSLTVIVENMWAHWLTWLRTQQIEDPLAVTPTDDALYDCAFHIWSLCQPHMASDYAVGVLAEFHNLLTLDGNVPGG